MSLRLAPEQIEQIKKRAQASGLTISQYMRAAFNAAEANAGSTEDFLLVRRQLLRVRWLLSTLSRDPNRADPVIFEAYLDEAVRQIDDAIGLAYANE